MPGVSLQAVSMGGRRGEGGGWWSIEASFTGIVGDVRASRLLAGLRQAFVNESVHFVLH